MISVPTSATIPLREFPLQWRWTNPTHTVFEQHEVQAIRAIDAHSSSSLRRLLRKVGASRPLWATTHADHRVLESSDLTDSEVRAWLEALPIDHSERLWLSYEWSDALELPWWLFLSRWSDFCYPSSDDLVLLPSSCSWALEYWHYEAFVWRPTLP